MSGGMPPLARFALARGEVYQVHKMLPVVCSVWPEGHFAFPALQSRPWEPNT